MIEQASLIIGDGNWAVKSDSLLGYALPQGKYTPREMSVVRATTGTRVNAAGLVEVVPYNFVEYSEQFENTAWAKQSVNITSNSIAAPNGTTTADTYQPTANDSYVFSNTNLNLPLGTFSGQIWVKGSPSSIGNTMRFWLWHLSSTGTTGLVTVTLTSEWQLVTISASVTGLGETRLRVDTFNHTNPFYIWGAQLNEGSLKDYLPTTTRLNIARIDYSTGSPALLVEPQRTNLLTYSEQFDDASWAANATITANTSISPDGTQNADTIAGSGFIGKTIVQTGIHTFSVFAKAGTSNEMRLNVFDGTTDRGVYYNLSNGTITSSYGTIIASDIVPYGNGWFRISITTNNAVISYVQIHRDSAQTCFIYGAQLEAGYYPTSYIPTTSASVTRNQDVISKTGISSLIGQTEGTLFFDLENNLGLDSTILTIDDGTNNNRFLLYTDSSTGYFNLFVASGGTGYDQASTIVSNNGKFAIAYNGSGFVVYRNGVSIISTNFPIPINMSAIRLNGRATNDIYALHAYNSVALWQTRLTNAQLAQLTTI